MVEKLGLFGGTFDPIHLGHLICAEQCRIQFELDEVIFFPARNPRFKEVARVSSACHRLEMVRLATRTNKFFKVSTVEIDVPGPSYTVDTVQTIKSSLKPSTELFLILGEDAVALLPSWKEPSLLADLCSFLILSRPNGGCLDWIQLEESVPGISHKVNKLDFPPIGISSTMIRERIAQGISIRYLVPEDVEKYIRSNRLFDVL
ncbi:MAG: nicotinate-nucleotide adenylyltransferase [Chloroflexota bacterium]|nr:nicotinate-nucleotide adenylyltransferase [Chloroflexota bacterium]